MRYLRGTFLLVIGLAGCWASSKPSGDGESPELTYPEAAEIEAVSGVPELDPPLVTVEGDHFATFDLLQNRPLAHRVVREEEGLSMWIDASEEDFVRYIQGNHRRDWSPFAEVEGGIAAGTRGREATLTLPGPVNEVDSVLELRVFNPARGDNSLTIGWNGESLDPERLAQGWQTLEFPLPGVSAENDLALSFSNLGRIDGRLSGGGILWARVGPVSPVEEVASPAEAEAEVEAEDEAEGEEEEEAEEEPMIHGGPGHEVLDQGPLSLADGTGYSWVLWVHEDAALDLEFRGEEECGVSLRLETERGGGLVETVLERDIILVEGRGEIQETSFALGLSEAQVARLTLLPLPDCGPVVLERAGTIRPGVIPGVPDEIEPPRFVIFWIIDTLRADYLPIHFETDVRAPNLQRLASEGVSFEVAYVQGTESRTSHATLFTGLYPERHGVGGRGRVDPNLKILPQFFQDAGYRTALMASNGYVSHLLNLNRGWNHYQNNIHNETGLDARTMVRESLQWIRSVEEGHPFFLYVGTIDPHVTYRRHPEVIEIYEPEPYHGRFQRFLSGNDLGLIKARAMSVTDREKERIINLYKNEITFNDLAFGEFREALEEMGIWEDTLIVVTSDHGEEFWEHGSVGHGHNVHQEMVHVPLMFYYPRGLPAGRSIRSGGEVVDILPTVLDLLGIDDPGDRQGMSLLPTIFGEHGGYPAPVLATQYLLQYGLQIQDWKLYLRSGSMRVYDRRTDVLEMNDVRSDHPLASRWLQDSTGYFRAYREEWDKATWGVTNNLRPGFVERIRGE